MALRHRFGFVGEFLFREQLGGAFAPPPPPCRTGRRAYQDAPHIGFRGLLFDSWPCKPEFDESVLQQILGPMTVSAGE